MHRSVWLKNVAIFSRLDSAGSVVEPNPHKRSKFAWTFYECFFPDIWFLRSECINPRAVSSLPPVFSLRYPTCWRRTEQVGEGELRFRHEPNYSDCKRGVNDLNVMNFNVDNEADLLPTTKSFWDRTLLLNNREYTERSY